MKLVTKPKTPHRKKQYVMDSTQQRALRVAVFEYVTDVAGNVCTIYACPDSYKYCRNVV
jgi:hypothetical protein